MCLWAHQMPLCQRRPRAATTAAVASVFHSSCTPPVGLPLRLDWPLDMSLALLQRTPAMVAPTAPSRCSPATPAVHPAPAAWPATSHPPRRASAKPRCPARRARRAGSAPGRPRPSRRPTAGRACPARTPSSAGRARSAPPTWNSAWPPSHRCARAPARLATRRPATPRRAVCLPLRARDAGARTCVASGSAFGQKARPVVPLSSWGWAVLAYTAHAHPTSSPRHCREPALSAMCMHLT